MIEILIRILETIFAPFFFEVTAIQDTKPFSPIAQRQRVPVLHIISALYNSYRQKCNM